METPGVGRTPPHQKAQTCAASDVNEAAPSNLGNAPTGDASPVDLGDLDQRHRAASRVGPANRIPIVAASGRHDAPNSAFARIARSLGHALALDAFRKAELRSGTQDGQGAARDVA